ncbi:ATP-grasp domain-containing protein [Salipiger sp. PrR003]|uniref:ATP-grasp domain-containing protein n=1 Tax=Salipiger sp. PrR003 TaxID=2706776 RepID=UPI0013D9A4F8|nr:ATP-grasp domain-containing protein [Salipiger sp. PrR003]NDV50178.1 ATP-grasp domain-containing protein [Salipiger sp. PrR003]
MTDFNYRLCNTDDPEERLEDAAMWKALHDVHGDNIRALGVDEDPDPSSVFFGRTSKKMQAMGKVDGIGLRPLKYCQMPAFTENAGRQFDVIDDIFEAEDRAREIMREHGAVFMKSTRQKHFAHYFDDPDVFDDIMEGMAFSFIDGGPALMVQEPVKMRYEQRFLFVEGDLITSSPVAYHLTPLANLPKGAQFATPSSKKPEIAPARDLTAFACHVATQAGLDAVCIDCAWDYSADKPLVIEFNEFHVGQMGLYNCDPTAIAEATLRPVFKTVLVPGKKKPSTTLTFDEHIGQVLDRLGLSEGDELEIQDEDFDDDLPVRSGP